jgi:hypothetical protein
MASSTEVNLPLVIVEWNDAWVRADIPVTLDDVASSHKPEVIITLGWVLRDDDAGISLANEYYDSTYRGRTFIPRGMIKAVTPYKLSKPRKMKAGPNEAD